MRRGVIVILLLQTTSDSAIESLVDFYETRRRAIEKPEIPIPCLASDDDWGPPPRTGVAPPNRHATARSRFEATEHQRRVRARLCLRVAKRVERNRR
jgi:hypothetical protein